MHSIQETAKKTTSEDLIVKHHWMCIEILQKSPASDFSFENNFVTEFCKIEF